MTMAILIAILVLALTITVSVVLFTLDSDQNYQLARERVFNTWMAFRGHEHEYPERVVLSRRKGE